LSIFVFRMNTKVVYIASFLSFIAASVFAQGDFTDSPDDLIEVQALPSAVRSDFIEDDEHFVVPEPVYLESMGRPKSPAYDRLFQSSGSQQIIFVEANPDLKVSQVHVLNSLGFEILCFPSVSYNKNNMLRLDLSPLKPGYYQLLLDGIKTITREISINDSNQVVYLK
jgi:hypothetical protein